MDKKYQIFVSSTYLDLKEARAKVIDTILEMYHFPVGMEMFNADDDDQWTIIKELISESDYYVVIIGHRYGSQTPDGISYTEKEYDFAKSIGVPILAFLRNENVALTDAERETAPELIEKIKNFRSKASSNKMVNFWSTTEELAGLVSVSLYKAFMRHPRVGWVRADKAVSQATVDELAYLIQENRKLREELAAAKAQINQRKPDIVVELNGGSPVRLTMQKVIVDEFHPEPLHIDRVPLQLQKYITPKDIQTYNENLPSQYEVDAYNRDLYRYRNTRINGQPLVLVTKNIGTAKAKDIHVTLTFPEGFTLLYKYEFEQMKEPARPKLPKNPVDVARKRYQEDTEYLAKLAKDIAVKLGNPYSIVPASIRLYQDDVGPATRIAQIAKAARIDSISRDCTIDIEGNVINIWYRELLHKNQWTYEEIIVVPSGVGEYTVDVQILYEEIPDMLHTTIPLVVEPAPENDTDPN